jgi:hypothetical protein
MVGGLSTDLVERVARNGGQINEIEVCQIKPDYFTLLLLGDVLSFGNPFWRFMKKTFALSSAITFFAVSAHSFAQMPADQNRVWQMQKCYTAIQDMNPHNGMQFYTIDHTDYMKYRSGVSAVNALRDKTGDPNRFYVFVGGKSLIVEFPSEKIEDSSNAHDRSDLDRNFSLNYLTEKGVFKKVYIYGNDMPKDEGDWDQIVVSSVPYIWEDGKSSHDFHYTQLPYNPDPAQLGEKLLRAKVLQSLTDLSKAYDEELTENHEEINDANARAARSMQDAVDQPRWEKEAQTRQKIITQRSFYVDQVQKACADVPDSKIHAVMLIAVDTNNRLAQDYLAKFGAELKDVQK